MIKDDDLLDIAASFRASQDQAEARLGEVLGLDRGVPFDAVLLVSPDVGMRLTRDGRIPARVRISWLLPPRTAYVVSSEMFAATGVTTSVTVRPSAKPSDPD